MLTVLRCRGIGEPMGDGSMLANVTKHLDPKRFRVVDVPWEASYGPVPDPWGSAFEAAVDDGMTLLIDMIADDPNPVVLTGYSGGGALAGNAASEIARGLHPGLDVRGVGLISDPLRPYAANAMSQGWGIAGARWISGSMPQWWMADPTDVITSCPKDSPLRTIADQSAAMSLADPAAWGLDLFDRLKTNRWQAVRVDIFNAMRTLAQYRRAAHDAEGYLFRRDHVSYDRRIYRDGRTYCEWLADRINEIRE